MLPIRLPTGLAYLAWLRLDFLNELKNIQERFCHALRDSTLAGHRVEWHLPVGRWGRQTQWDFMSTPAFKGQFECLSGCECVQFARFEKQHHVHQVFHSRVHIAARKGVCMKLLGELLFASQGSDARSFDTGKCQPIPALDCFRWANDHVALDLHQRESVKMFVQPFLLRRDSGHRHTARPSDP